MLSTHLLIPNFPVTEPRERYGARAGMILRAETTTTEFKQHCTPSMVQEEEVELMSHLRSRNILLQYRLILLDWFPRRMILASSESSNPWSAETTPF